MCDGRNCQSTKSVCDDKNCQFTKCEHMQKAAISQFSYKKCGKSAVTQSHLSRNSRKQIGTQSEVTRNCQDSTGKCWYPSVSTNVFPDSRNYKMQSMNSVNLQDDNMLPVAAKLKKSQVNTRSQVQTSKYKSLIFKVLCIYLGWITILLQCMHMANGIGEYLTASTYKTIL